MQAAIVGFIIGIAALQQQEILPNKTILICLGITSVILISLSFLTQLTEKLRLLKPLFRLASGLALGILWASVLALYYLGHSLPKNLENQDIVVTGTVINLPQPFEDGVRFHLQIDKALYQNNPVTLPEKIALSWGTKFHLSGQKTIPDIQPGQQWQLNIRLKQPHGNINPKSFDYEVWLLEQSIRATGYVNNNVRLPHQNTLIESFKFTPINLVNKLRSALRERIQKALPEHEYAGIIVALVIGDQKAISQSDWEIFNRTGISHLVAISGLHITLISGLFALFASALWRRSFFTQKQLPLILPAQKVAAIAGVAMALIYVLLAGFGIPAQRTLYMIIIVAIALWNGHITRFSHVLLNAAGVVLFFDPWAVLQPGFWLSFGAVGIILYATSNRTRTLYHKDTRFKHLRETLTSATRTQWAVTLGLIPLTILFFGRISLIGPVANAIAIPLVSLIITPLALIGSILPSPLIEFILTTAHYLIEMLAYLLKWLSSFSFAVWSAPIPSFYLILFASAGTLWILAPKGWPHRYLGILCWFPLLLNTPDHPDFGEASITVFDVGQGNSILIETQKHRLLFDTGPVYSSESDAGIRVIEPYLKSRAIDKLDTIIVSHADNDHSGGLLSLIQKISVEQIITSIDPHSFLGKLLPPYRPCIAGQQWEWDKVHFEILYPAINDYLNNNKTNDLSCILKVETSKFSILLTGDLENKQEQKLIDRLNPKLNSDILLAPHHGSNTSSSWPFLFAVKPQIAVFQVGYLNPYHHPDHRVIERYNLLQINTLRTDENGAITFKMSDELTTETARKSHKKYWHNY